MKNEASAGGIVYKKINPSISFTLREIEELRTSDQILWLVVHHSYHKGWVFPKGLTTDHDGENDLKTTALREVQEEGGIIAKIISEKPFFNEYWYQFKKEKIHKKVYYFLMEYISGSELNHDSEVSEALWLPEKEVLDKLTFKNDRKNFEEAVKEMKL